MATRDVYHQHMSEFIATAYERDERTTQKDPAYAMTCSGTCSRRFGLTMNQGNMQNKQIAAAT